ncbi:tetratricopeptide repeat protein [Formosa sp. A9]|uniref:tetratricopeptide repeat protein n=1 Tax=Formosa sp. A9 TaxID=3442641 RepID=UPI003EB9A1C1
MKKIAYFIAVLFIMGTVATSFTSCRDENKSTSEKVEDVADDIEDGVEDAGDAIEDGLQPHMMPSQGTGFKMLFTKLDSLFVDNKAPGRVLVFTDDLEDLNLADVTNFVQNNNTSLNFYPMATQEGGQVPSFYNHKVALKEKGNVIASKLNSNTQEALKQVDSVAVMDMTLDKSDVTLFAESVSDHLIFEEKPKNEDEHWQDNGYWLLIPLMVLFLFSFRKGWSLLTVVLCFSVLSCQSDKADKKEDTFQFKDLWYTKSYQAQQQYDNKEYAQAAKGFTDPMHKGSAYYKAGNFTKAREEFEKDSTANGQYNLGLTYAKLGDLTKAQQVFETLVKDHPDMAQAQNDLQNINEALLQKDEMSAEESKVGEDKPNAKNKHNDSMEDLSGGGQKATKKDMEKQRLEETVNTGKRKGKEMEELPDDFKSGKGGIPKDILMRKVDDDPALFLKRKFQYQVKHHQVDVEQTETSW